MRPVTCKQRLLHKNEIVQFLPNYKCQNINQGQLRKHLRGNRHENRSIFSYFLSLNWYNLRTASKNQSIVREKKRPLETMFEIRFLEIFFCFFFKEKR